MALFTVAGVSVNKGTIKVRFCSDLVLRIKNLQKQGDTDIQLIDLPKPMSKYDACQHLLDCGQFDQFANDIIDVMGKKAPKTSQPKVTAPTVTVDEEVESIKELAEV